MRWRKPAPWRRGASAFRFAAFAKLEGCNGWLDATPTQFATKLGAVTGLVRHQLFRVYPGTSRLRSTAIVCNVTSASVISFDCAPSLYKPMSSPWPSTTTITGDMTKALVEKGKKQAVYIERVAVQSSGKFDITTCMGNV